MKKSFGVMLAAVMLSTFAVLTQVSAGPSVSWKEAEKAVRKAWAQGYPKEKIIKIEQNGDPTYYEKVEKGVKVSYCDFPAKVLAQQSSSKRVFNVTAIFRKSGGKFAFKNLGVGESTALAEKGQEAPSKPEIKKLIADLWVEKNPGSKVTKVLISDPELKKDSSKGRWWYNVGADIFVTTAEGANKKYVTDYTTVYKGEKEKEGVDASGPWKVDFFDKPIEKK